MRVLALLALISGGQVFAGDTFTFEMPDPRLRIVVPDIPQMRMAVHPNNAMQPHARFMGSDDRTGHVVSVLLPTADAGMTARECAQAGSRAVVKRFGLDPKFVVTLQPEENTFVMLFPYRVEPVLQFKAFLLSGYKGTHCVEVHISRTMAPAAERALAEDLAKWFQGFRGARIVAY